MMWLREFFRPARRPVLGVCKYSGGVILAGISCQMSLAILSLSILKELL